MKREGEEKCVRIGASRPECKCFNHILDAWSKKHRHGSWSTNSHVAGYFSKMRAGSIKYRKIPRPCHKGIAASPSYPLRNIVHVFHPRLRVPTLFLFIYLSSPFLRVLRIVRPSRALFPMPSTGEWNR